MPVLEPKLVQQIKKSPSDSGVYIFKNQSGVVLYIGKAINLKRRLLYYTKDEDDLYEKTAHFLRQSTRLEWIVVHNDIEALLLEMNLIRTLKPKYNILSKDDKRPLFIHITNDELPRIRTARLEIANTGDYIGPFPSGYKLKYILKSLRRIFPFCSCNQKRKTPCMFYDLGLCPGPMTFSSQEQKNHYRRQIRYIKLFLQGDIAKVTRILTKQMTQHSVKQEYEKAQEIKKQLEAIDLLIKQPSSINNYFKDNSISQQVSQSQWKALQDFLQLEDLTRVEGYDIANTSGKQATASMVVFIKSFPDTSQYRKFKIYGIDDPNDPLMMEHALNRRLKNSQWDYPQLILVDGGKTQVKAALKAVKNAQLEIRVVGLAKRFEQLVIPVGKELKIVSPPLDSPFLTMLRQIRDEAHRFTTAYHKKLRQKSMFS